MKILCIFLSICLYSQILLADKFYTWRARSHATDVTSIIDGQLYDLGYQENSQMVYRCTNTSGASSPDEWKIVMGVARGYIKDGYVKYKNTTQITVVKGMWECNGSVSILTANTDVSCSVGSGSDWWYIYDDDSARSGNTPTLISSTTEPAYDFDKLGWYNGNDRCIGAAWENSSNVLANFIYIGCDRYCYDQIQVVTNGTPTGAYIEVNITAYLPIQAPGAYIKASGEDYLAEVKVIVRAKDNSESKCTDFGYDQAFDVSWVHWGVGNTKFIEWVGDSDDDPAFNVWIIGYEIPR